MSDKIPDEALDLLAEIKYKKVAELFVAGVSVVAIAKELKTTRRAINRLMAEDEFKGHLREMADQMVAAAANYWKAAMQERVAPAMKVLDFHLKNNNLEAVKIILRSIGLEKLEPVQQSSQLTVVLPDFSQPKVVPSEIE